MLTPLRSTDDGLGGEALLADEAAQLADRSVEPPADLEELRAGVDLTPPADRVAGVEGDLGVVVHGSSLSAYERGLKVPSLGTASRIIEATDHELTLQARIDWWEHHPPGIQAFWVPHMLWAVPPPVCFVSLWFPDLIELGPRDTWDLVRRDDRQRAYTLLVRRGLPQQMIRWMDGGLLVDRVDLDLPDPVCAAWEPAIRGPGLL